MPESLIEGTAVSWLLTVEKLCFIISTGWSRDVIGSGTTLSGFFLFCFVLLFSSTESAEFDDLDDQIFLKKRDIFLEFDLIAFGDSDSDFWLASAAFVCWGERLFVPVAMESLSAEDGPPVWVKGNDELEGESGKVEDGGSLAIWFLGVKFSPLGNWKALSSAFFVIGKE